MVSPRSIAQKQQAHLAVGESIRVAFITHYTSLYGANRSLLGLIDGLTGYGVTPYVVAPEGGPITDALRERNVAVATVPMQLWVAGHRNPNGLGGVNPAKRLYRFLNWHRHAMKRLYANICVLPTLVKQLKSWNVDVVHTNSSVIAIGAMAARIIRRPHIWHVREFSDLDYNLDYDLGRRTFRYFINRADARIAISKAILSYHLRDSKPEGTYVIYNGVATVAEFSRLYNEVNSNGTPGRNRPYTFALVGGIHPGKGQDVAIRSLGLLASEFPEVRLLIVGAGSTDLLRKLADELGVSNNVEFWGHVDDPYRAYLASDAVLMCSKNEAMGRVTVEAMSACRPVIGYDNAGTSEIIEHEHTGLLYHGGPEALASCMRRFIQNSGWARELGNNGWHVAREKYTVEAYAQSFYKILSSVVPLRNTAAETH
jgi:Glycosyltransferase